jgi:hypothetical protein
VEITANHLVPWAPNKLLSAWHGLHGRRYDFNAHPFTIAGCEVSRHLDAKKNRPKGSPKAELAWAVGPAKSHYRNFTILARVKTSDPLAKIAYDVQVENQLDFHLPQHVMVHRLPYHEELAAAIKDLTSVLRKSSPTEAIGSANAEQVSLLGNNLLQAAQQAHRIFGTPPPPDTPLPGYDSHP